MVMNNLMHVPINRKASKTKVIDSTLESENCGFLMSNTILFPQIMRIVGAQLVTLSCFCQRQGLYP